MEHPVYANIRLKELYFCGPGNIGSITATNVVIVIVGVGVLVVQIPKTSPFLNRS